VCKKERGKTVLKKVSMIPTLFVAIFALSTISKLVSAQEWVPYVPCPEQVELYYWTVDKWAYINVTITCATPCYQFDWGTVSRDRLQLWADAKIWRFTGPCILVITKFRHVYELGQLKHGKTYTFTFKVWGYSIKSITFKHLPR